jgi:ribosome maturation factor RimP
MAKGKGGNTVAAVTAIVAPIAESLGLRLWDVRFVKEGANWYLRIFIDKDGGIDIEDCVNMSHAIEEPLDRLDPIEQSYNLQVSSPGIERDLVRDEHFTEFKGEKIKVKMIRPVDGKREFSGILESYEDGNITIRLEDESGFTFTKKEASFVKLDDFDM